MSYRILIAGLLAGLFAGLITSVLQQALTVPIIHIAETFESGHHDHAAPDAAASPDATTGHVHDSSAWAPSEGLERIAFTTLATVGACIGFAFILVAGMILLGEAPSARRGLIWGGCFFIAFSLAPALGLPPELPGMEAGALPFRQAWWFGTIATSLLGLWLILKVGKPIAIVIGAIVMIAPHLVGAPLSVVPMNSAVPPELSARFVVNAMVVAAAMWLMIGSLAGLIWQRLERSAP